MQLIDDIFSIVDQGKTSGLNHEKMTMTDPYEISKSKKTFVNEAIHATNEMQDERKKV